MDEITEIGSICSSLISNPTFKASQHFDILLKHCRSPKPKVSRLAVLSLAKVLSDLTPGYVVSKYAETDRPSKDVKSRREFDKLILDVSQRFVQFAEKKASHKSLLLKNRIYMSKGISLLFQTKPNFNTSATLAKIVVKLACNSVEQIRQPACQSIQSIFQNETTRSASLLIFSNIASLKIKDISTDLLESIRLFKPKEFDHQKSQDKIETDDKDLLKDLKEADIVNDHSEQEQNQTLILEHLFATLFKFLKETKNEVQFLYSMELIRHFVKWINFDFVAPIITALKQNRFSLRASITSLQTALALCEQANYFVDLKDFYQAVYSMSFESFEHRDALIEYLALFDIISKSADKSRIAAFAKRLLIMGLHSSIDVTAAILCHLRNLIPKLLELTAALDFEYETEGRFDIESNDPDFCFGLGAKYWELAEFGSSSNPILKSLASELAELKDHEKVIQADIKAARNKVSFKPRDMLENLDDSYRIFDATQLVIDPFELPKEFKNFEFEE